MHHRLRRPVCLAAAALSFAAWADASRSPPDWVNQGSLSILDGPDEARGIVGVGFFSDEVDGGSQEFAALARAVAEVSKNIGSLRSQTSFEAKPYGIVSALDGGTAFRAQVESRFGRVRVRVENDDTQWTNPHAASSAPQDVDVRQLLEISLADFSIRDEMSSRTAGDMSASEGHETVLLQFETTTTDRFAAEPERAGFTLGPVWSDHEPETPTTYARVRYAPSTTLQLRGPAAQCMLDGKAVRESVSVGWHSVDCTAKDRAPWHARILAFGEPISVLPDPRPLEAGKVQLIQLPGGTTRMGCPARDGPCEKKRGAGHDATFQPFWMARTETTVRDYQRCVQEGKCADTSSAKDAGCNRGPEKSDHPVNCVTLEQANRFCSWAGARLPSLDEWRYAARSGQPALSGGLAEDKRVNIHQNHAGTIPVGSLPLPNNAFDLQDLGGNVSEWTSSLLQGKPVVAGGSFASRKEVGSWGHFRASQPDSSAAEVGFRCAR